MEAIKDAVLAKNYLTAGSSIFTLQSKVTLDRLTFKVEASETTDSSKMYFVKVLTGSDNSANYSYAGILLDRVDHLEFRLTPKSKISWESKAFKAFDYLVKNVNKGAINENLNVLPSNTCCRCGRLLTTPESISAGIGPECIRIATKKGKW